MNRLLLQNYHKFEPIWIKFGPKSGRLVYKWDTFSLEIVLRMGPLSNSHIKPNLSYSLRVSVKLYTQSRVQKGQKSTLIRINPDRPFRVKSPTHADLP